MSGQVPWAGRIGSTTALRPLPEAAGAGIVPAWVRRLAGEARPHPGTSVGRSGVPLLASLATRAGFALAEVSVPAAGLLPAARLRQVAGEAYRAVRDLAGECGRPHPLRFWNVIPGINEPLSPDGCSRYMVFNSARHESLGAWLGRPDGGRWAVPTATGVGSRDQDLRLACLLSDEPGVPVENPRQRPAYRYDRVYGPRPPCFSRATLAVAGGERQLLIGGTASVRGQDSRHRGLLGAQYDEACRNLAALVAQVLPRGRAGLDRITFRHLRAYVPDPAHLHQVESRIRSTLRCRQEPEILCMDLCRPELLVELEGVMALPEAAGEYRLHPRTGGDER